MVLSDVGRERARNALDVVIALVAGLFGIADVLTASKDFPSHSPLLAATVGAAGFVLVIRRRYPLVCLVAVLSLLSLAGVIWGSYQAGSTLLIGFIAVYSATAYGVTLWLTVALIAVASVLMSAHNTFTKFLNDMAFVFLISSVVAVAGYYARRYRALAAAEAARRELVELSAISDAQAAVAAERARVARELHDILSHSLGVVVLQTGAAEHAWDSDPARARESLVAARHTALEAVDQLRLLLTAVRENPSSDREPLPTLDNLQDLANRTSGSGFDVVLEIVGEPREVAPQVQSSIYRVAQEGVANAIKHSGAHRCVVRLTYTPEAVEVEVCDDGTGAHEAAGSQQGLVGIRERAALFGGRAQAGPDGTRGWRLAVSFPS
jgi:signal transduction histidine kinase